MKKNRQRFWMVLVDEGEAPKHRHYELKGAMKEAERLAKLTGQDVFLLEANSLVRYTPPIPPPELEWKPTLE